MLLIAISQFAMAFFRSPRAVYPRARPTYVTNVSSSRLTLIRAPTDGDDDPYPSAWARLARGGVDVREVHSEGIRHDNIMGEPHVGVVAAILEDAIAAALDGADRRDDID